MPERIDLTIFWAPDNDAMAFYSLYPAEIYEISMNYDVDQINLFTFFDPEIIRQWIWDMFCREPNEIIVEEIIY